MFMAARQDKVRGMTRRVRKSSSPLDGATACHAPPPVPSISAFVTALCTLFLAECKVWIHSNQHR